MRAMVLPAGGSPRGAVHKPGRARTLRWLAFAVCGVTACQQSGESGSVLPGKPAESARSTGEIGNPPPDADPYWLTRQRMVRDTIESPAAIDDRPPVQDARVLAAMRTVPRHEFVPADSRALAYLDSALDIGHEQTISQPYIVALMTELLRLEPDHKVLEIGTGSGYQAAVLAELVEDVYSIEIVRPLGERAAEVLGRRGYDNVHLRIGDGYRGWPEEAPFDRILVTCAPEDVPGALVEQLAVGGRLVIPVGPRWPAQELVVLVKEGEGELTREVVMGVRFVEMTGGDQE